MNRRDTIAVSDLLLTTASLPADLWHRPAKLQPLLLSLSIRTDISNEAAADSLLASSLNYGTVTKTLEKAVADLALAPQEWDLEELAELLATKVLFDAHGPNVRLTLERPRALLTAESVGITISRTRADYDPSTRTLHPSSTAPSSDVLFVKALKQDIIIGVNACERQEVQPVIVDLEFGVPDQMRYLGGKRAGWKDWRLAVNAVQSHLATSKPLTIESITTTIASLLLAPPCSPAAISPTWDVPLTTVKLSKPAALMFAKHPSVQIHRLRDDFYFPTGHLKVQTRGVSTSAGSVTSSLPSSNGAEESWSDTASDLTAATEAGPAGGSHTAVLAIGTNLGERISNISRALKAIEKSGQVTIVDTSFLYESEAMYVTDQERFLNAVLKVETSLLPIPLLNFLKSVEDSLGRVKTIRNGPRVIDLDILFYDNLVLEEGDGHRWLRIPHASIAEREFVLRPLVDLIPDYKHPVLHSTPTALLSTLLHSAPTTLHRVLPLSTTKSHPLGSRTLVMSILNTTPDSFSDGGDHFHLSSALDAVRSQVAQGVDIIDIGGMSTRPGADDVSEEEEKRRVCELVKAIRDEGTNIAISVDTFRPSVARAAILAGADIINDVLGGSYPGMLETMAELDVPVVLMHSRGTPKNMSALTEYEHGDVVRGVRRELEARVRDALDAGVRRWNIVLDPGIGFAKTGTQNVALLRHLPEVLGRFASHAPAADEDFLAPFPSLVGLSRKKFLGTLTGKVEPKERVWATAAGVTASVAGGTDIVRVHDVEMGLDVVKVSDAIWRS